MWNQGSITWDHKVLKDDINSWNMCGIMMKLLLKIGMFSFFFDLWADVHYYLMGTSSILRTQKFFSFKTYWCLKHLFLTQEAGSHTRFFGHYSKITLILNCISAQNMKTYEENTFVVWKSHFKFYRSLCIGEAIRFIPLPFWKTQKTKTSLIYVSEEALIPRTARRKASGDVTTQKLEDNIFFSSELSCHKLLTTLFF